MAFNVDGKYIDEIIDELYYLHSDDDSRRDKIFDAEHFEQIKFLLSHRVKLRMKLNLLGKMTSVAEGVAENAGGFNLKSAPASRQPSKESLDQEDSSRPTTPSKMMSSSPRQPHPPQDSLSASPPSDCGGPTFIPRANSTSTSSREKSVRMVRKTRYILDEEAPKL